VEENDVEFGKKDASVEIQWNYEHDVSNGGDLALAWLEAIRGNDVKEDQNVEIKDAVADPLALTKIVIHLQ